MPTAAPRRQVYPAHAAELTAFLGLRAVSRIKCKGDLYEMDLLLDVNTDLYPVEVRQRCSRGAARLLAGRCAS